MPSSSSDSDSPVPEEIGEKLANSESDDVNLKPSDLRPGDLRPGDAGPSDTGPSDAGRDVIQDEATRTLDSRANSDSFDGSLISLDLEALPSSPGGPAASPIGDEESEPLPETIGDYRVGKCLGRGGMGEVFLAEHRSMGRIVALKILPMRWLNRSTSVDRFYEEIRAASRLMHPNIVTAFDAGQSAGIHYLAMEYIDGVNLAQAVAEDGPMSIGDATSAIRQAAFALHHAHSAGIVHRDVKPANLMRSREGTIKLLDLGLARFSREWHRAKQNSNDASPEAPLRDSDVPRSDGHSEARQSGSEGNSGLSEEELQVVTSAKRGFLGTLSFISPEQLVDASSADARSDQYSLGATLFHLLVGHPPYPGEAIEQVYGHRHGDIPDLMSFRQDVDLTLANIVTRMLAKDPAARYGSMDEVARAMAPYDNDRSTPAWVLDFARRNASDDGSNNGDASRSRSADKSKPISTIGIDLGMLHAASAVGLSDGSVQAGWPVAGDSGPQSLFRMAVADSGSPEADDESTEKTRKALFGQAAYELRRHYTRKVSYCQMMYFGRHDMLRQIAGRNCPPEIAVSLCLRHLVGTTLMNHTLAKQSGLADADLIGKQGLANSRRSASINTVLGTAWHRHESWPDAIAITVPACYDQLHRRSIQTAARIAGFPSVRLVDRSVAISCFAFEQSQHGSPARSKYVDQENEGPENLNDVIEDIDSFVLYVGLTGQALDVAVLRRRENKIEQIASSGHWCLGSMAWSSRLVDLIISKLPPRTPLQGQDITPESRLQDRLIYAAKLQMAGERAMNSLLLLPKTKIEVLHRGQTQSITVTREQWFESCRDLIDAIPQAIQTACQRAAVPSSKISRCLVLSSVLRLPSLRERVFSQLKDSVKTEFFDYTDAARGAVACVTAERAGKKSNLLPVVTRTSHSVGFVVSDKSGKRKILPILSRGTSTPARTNRQLGGRVKDNQLTLALVESSGVQDESWQSLGRHVIPVDSEESVPTRRLGFEVDINGLMSVHLERPDLGRTIELPVLPQMAVSSDQWEDWQEWVADHA